MSEDRFKCVEDDCGRCQRWFRLCGGHENCYGGSPCPLCKYARLKEREECTSCKYYDSKKTEHV